MTSHKLKKTLRERPFLIDNCFTLSDTEAAYLIDRRGYPDIERVIARAKSKVDWPRETWHELDALVEKRSGARLRRMIIEHHNKAASFILRHRRLAAICLVLLMLAGFFGFVPAGRALAEQVYKAVIRLIDDILVISMPKDMSNSSDFRVGVSENAKGVILSPKQNQGEDIIASEYTIIESFIADTGVTPLILTENWLTLNQIDYLTSEHDGCSLILQYISDTGTLVSTIQIWNASSDMVAFTNNESFELYNSETNINVYYTVDAIDNSIYSTSLIKDTVFIVAAKGDISIDDILSLYDFLD